MTPFLQLALALALIIAAAKIAGYFSYRLGQPAVLGELLVGVLLGPTAINLLNITFFTDQHLSSVIYELAEIGVLLLMFLAGLDLEFSDLARTGKVSILAGACGVIFPLMFGLAAGLAFGLALQSAIFLGLILAATSVSISAQTLIELKVIRSRVGISLLGAAIFDDILVVLGLSIFSALTNAEAGSRFLDILWIILRMTVFVGGATFLGWILLPRLSQKVDHLPISQGLIAFTLVMIFIYGWSSEALGGMAAITGAFLAGLAFSRSPVRERIHSGMNALAYGLFVPIFFINIGLTTDARILVSPSFWLFLVLVILAILGKVLGAGLGGWLGGLERREALQLGIGMISRGEVGLIVASAGITGNLINPAEFAAIVGVVIVTTLLTPPLLRAAFHHAKPPSPALPAMLKGETE